MTDFFPHQASSAQGTPTNLLCQRILALLLRHHRAASDTEGHTHTPETCFSPQLDRLSALVGRRQLILLTLPAFPCKSPNPAKVIGHLPDLGELLSLRFLNDLCAAISSVYEPGARLLICSDGHVFGDLINVCDDHIDAYGTALREMISSNGLNHIDTFNLNHVYTGASYDEKRALLEKDYAVSEEELRADTRNDDSTLAQYRGMIRFLVEDTTYWAGSKAQLQRDCRRRAHAVLRRSRAWSALIDQRHRDSLRLSIHPQECRSTKLGISLLETKDNWLTPWHAVVVQTGVDRFCLMKRHEAELIGIPAGPSWRPSHYIATELFAAAS